MSELQRKFEEFHRSNPSVWELFKMFSIGAGAIYFPFDSEKPTLKA